MGALAETPASSLSLSATRTHIVSSPPPLRGMMRSEPTAQELRVMKLLAEGKSSKEVGLALGIETATAETHRANIYRRMGFRNLVELTHWALAHGIVDNLYHDPEFFGS
jgi:DNA-binding NarL/FixJ family response regulator